MPLGRKKNSTTAQSIDSCFAYSWQEQSSCKRQFQFSECNSKLLKRRFKFYEVSANFFKTGTGSEKITGYLVFGNK
jgi:hypothetical protein